MSSCFALPASSAHRPFPPMQARTVQERSRLCQDPAHKISMYPLRHRLVQQYVRSPPEVARSRLGRGTCHGQYRNIDFGKRVFLSCPGGQDFLCKERSAIVEPSGSVVRTNQIDPSSSAHLLVSCRRAKPPLVSLEDGQLDSLFTHFLVTHCPLDLAVGRRS